MTRIIKASEVKPGMEVQFDLSGWDVKGTVATVDVCPHAVWIYTEKCFGMPLDLDSPVTVLSKPAPAQPEEPTEFGAKVRVRDGRFVRLDWEDSSSRPWHEKGTGYRWSWDDLCEMGPVTVVPDQGWTVPTDAPEVPERIDEWDTWEDVPEGVVVTVPGLFCHYRKARGKDEVLGRFDGVWGETRLHLGAYPGPWTRVSDV